VPEERPPATESWAYLIAAKNGSLWLARDYSIRDSAVHIIMQDGQGKQLPLSDLDLTATEQLNRERGVALRLP
jgi:hypothetical protein